MEAKLPSTPKSLEAEQAFLGSLIMDSTSWDQISHMVQTKDFFDRTYEDLQNKMCGLPIFYYVRAGLDGNGCKIGIDKILTGLKWRQVLPPLILKGKWDDDFILRLEEKSLTFVNGIEMGIY